MSAGADPNVSNGTCYSTENTETKGDFIPCGNTAFGHWPCCHAGDFCLSFDDANACWDLETGNTYLAGCTDPGFNDRACPWKSNQFHDQEWVAIQQCQKGTGSNDTIWGGCKISPNSTELEKLPHQSCDPYCSSSIYVGNTALPAYASLPNSTGDFIAWTSGFDPTVVYAPTTTTAEVSGVKTTITSIGSHPPTTSATASQATSATISQPTSTTSAAAAATTTAAADPGLSTGAKAGIGVGAAGAALLLVAVVLLTLLIRRRRKKTEAAQYNAPLEQDQAGPPSPYHIYQAYQPTQPSPKPWHNENISEAYAGFKSELPANERPVTSELPADPSTIPRTYISPQPSPYLSTASPNSPYGTLDSGTDQVSSYSDSTTVHGGNSRWITPESTGNISQPGIPPGRGHSPMQPVSESHW